MGGPELKHCDDQTAVQRRHRLQHEQLGHLQRPGPVFINEDLENGPLIK